MSSSTQLLILPSHTPNYPATAIEKSSASESFHPNGTNFDFPLINGQLSDVSKATKSSPNSGRFEFEDVPTWTVLPKGGLDDELEQTDDVDSDFDEGPRKRQKTQTGSITGNAQITTNVLVKSQEDISTIVDGGSRKRKLSRLKNLVPSTALAVDSADTRVIDVAIPKTEPSPTTTTSSYNPIEKSNLSPTAALNQNPSVKEGNSAPALTHNRKRANELSGLLLSRPLAMSKSTSIADSSYSEVLKDRDEPPRKTRGPALRPTNSSYGTKLKKPQSYIADQDELESWTNADIARVGFRSPDETRVLEEVEEENVKRNVRCTFKSLMETDIEGSNDNVARNEWTFSNYAVAMPDSSIYTRCNDLVEEIFGPSIRNRRMERKTVLRSSSTLQLELMTCVCIGSGKRKRDFRHKQSII